MNDLPLRGGSLQVLACVGTKEGRVLAYRVDMDGKLLFKSKGGLMYGQVSSLSIQDSGMQLIAASDSGELLQFNLLQGIGGVE